MEQYLISSNADLQVNKNHADTVQNRLNSLLLMFFALVLSTLTATAQETNTVIKMKTAAPRHNTAHLHAAIRGSNGDRCRC